MTEYYASLKDNEAFQEFSKFTTDGENLGKSPAGVEQTPANSGRNDYVDGRGGGI